MGQFKIPAKFQLKMSQFKIPAKFQLKMIQFKIPAKFQLKMSQLKIPAKFQLKMSQFIFPAKFQLRMSTLKFPPNSRSWNGSELKSSVEEIVTRAVNSGHVATAAKHKMKECLCNSGNVAKLSAEVSAAVVAAAYFRFLL
jgi:hypothetical protein